MSSLDWLFPSNKWSRDCEGVPRGILMFCYEQAPLRVILVPGLRPGTRQIIGYHVLFRSGDDSMNMLLELQDSDTPSLSAAISTAVEISSHANISHEKLDRKSTRLNSSHLGIS